VAGGEDKGIKDGVCVEMGEVKQKLEALVAYMREAFVRSPWNYANISSYDKAFKDVWWQYTAEIEAMCAVADGLDATTAARLELMSKSRCLEVEYDGSGDPYAGSQTYTPTKTAWNLDKHHIMTELRACAELVKNGRVGMSDPKSADMTAYTQLAHEEKVQLEMSASAMMNRLDALVGHVWYNGQQETKYGKGFEEACKTAHAIRDEVLNEKKRRYVYAPERYATARGKVDAGMAQLEGVPGFAGLERMKTCGKECQELMEVYAEVWRKIREFDATHSNPYVVWRSMRRIHAFSDEKKDEKKASMEEMLRELKVLSVRDI
jgi:hypothetical protein